MTTYAPVIGTHTPLPSTDITHGSPAASSPTHGPSTHALSNTGIPLPRVALSAVTYSFPSTLPAFPIKPLPGTGGGGGGGTVGYAI